MSLPSDLEAIPGAQQLFEWFGYWPTFHDAEVISLELKRSGESTLAVHAWEMTNRVDDKGYYEQTKHAVVQFVLEDILELNLNGFSCQNVIARLSLSKTQTGFLLDLAPCYGFSGTIEAERISISLVPGKPPKDE
jgi:hypothetical protein